MISRKISYSIVIITYLHTNAKVKTKDKYDI